MRSSLFGSNVIFIFMSAAHLTIEGVSFGYPPTWSIPDIVSNKKNLLVNRHESVNDDPELGYFSFLSTKFFISTGTSIRLPLAS